jgi:hypothetical protein
MVKLFLILFNLSMVHPVHVSMASLYGDNNSGDMVLTVRMYTDDLALDLYRLYDAEGEYSEFDHMFIFTGSDSYYEKYINEHLKIYHKGEVLGIELVKKEILDLETLLKFSVDIKCIPGGDIKIENKILTGLYIDQVNLFILKLDNFEKGVKFTAAKTKELFSR